MRRSSFILRCAAFVLLLVFSQKMGGGLLLHNLFHKSAGSSSADDKNKEISYACNCVDDFLVPLVETDETVVTSPIAVATVFNSFLSFEIPYRSPFHSSLRGPPSVKA